MRILIGAVLLFLSGTAVADALEVTFPRAPTTDVVGLPAQVIGWDVYVNGALREEGVPLSVSTRVYDIEEFRQYRVQVAAVNSVGAAELSPATTVNYEQPRGVPSRAGAPGVRILMIGGGGGGTPPGGGGNPPGGDPYDLSAHIAAINFSTAFATAPTTTRTATVNSASEFNTQAGIAATQITIGSSFSGSISVTADDIDVVMPNNLTITGDLTFDGINRLRWTGGNIDNSGNGMDWRNFRDVLFDDVVIEAALLMYSNNREAQRLSMVNTTVDSRANTGTSQFAIYSQQNQFGYDGFIFANIKADNAVNSAFRLQSATNTVVVDSAFMMLRQDIDQTAFRFSVESNNAYVAGTASKPMYWCGRAHFSYLDAGAFAIQNAEFDNIIQYRSFGTMATHAGSNSGSVANHTLFSSNFNVGDAVGISPFTDAGGNAVVQAWDGSTFPDVSSYGASAR